MKIREKEFYKFLVLIFCFIYMFKILEFLFVFEFEYLNMFK